MIGTWVSMLNSVNKVGEMVIDISKVFETLNQNLIVSK